VLEEQRFPVFQELVKNQSLKLNPENSKLKIQTKFKLGLFERNYRHGPKKQSTWLMCDFQNFKQLCQQMILVNMVQILFQL